LIPELHTGRLLLRGHRPDDFADCFAMWSDPAVTRFIGGRPFTEEEVWARFLRYAGHWHVLGFGFWVVEECSTGRFAGEVGFANLKRDIQPSLDEYPELGWVLASEFHGRGYATEAVSAALDWGRVNLPAKTTACIIHPANAASLRVAEKCGFRKRCDAVYKGHSTVMFTREL